jgi:vacuole morphology and inheritance protein 14
MDDGTFPALLKNLSDTSEEVIKYDLQLLARISTNSDESYFKSFMINLLGLFSTDKRLLETRGSLIIRQLCLSLNTERIYRTLAEILEKEEVAISLFPTRPLTDFMRSNRTSFSPVIWYRSLISF